MTVLRVLAEAGGLTDYAKKKKIYILRTMTGGAVPVRAVINNTPSNVVTVAIR